MNGAGLLFLVTDTEEKLHLVPRSEVSGVTAASEGVNVEEYAPWAPLVLVANEPILCGGQRSACVNPSVFCRTPVIMVANEPILCRGQGSSV